MDSEQTDNAKYLRDVNRELALRAHERARQAQADYLKASLDSSASAIRLLVLVNGAAVVAVLAFTGAVESSPGADQFSASQLVKPMTFFALGVAFAALSSVLAYLVMLLDHSISNAVVFTWEHPYVEKDPERNHAWHLDWRIGLHYTAMASALLSLLMFFGGVISIGLAITLAGI